MIVFLIILTLILILGGMAAIIFAMGETDGIISGVVAAGYLLIFLVLIVVSSEYGRQNTINEIGSGEATIDTIYTIQNQDTIKTEYKIINNPE